MSLTMKLSGSALAAGDAVLVAHRLVLHLLHAARILRPRFGEEVRLEAAEPPGSFQLGFAAFT